MIKKLPPLSRVLRRPVAIVLSAVLALSGIITVALTQHVWGADGQDGYYAPPEYDYIYEGDDPETEEDEDEDYAYPPYEDEEVVPPYDDEENEEEADENCEYYGTEDCTCLPDLDIIDEEAGDHNVNIAFIFPEDLDEHVSSATIPFGLEAHHIEAHLMRGVEAFVFYVNEYSERVLLDQIIDVSVDYSGLDVYGVFPHNVFWVTYTATTPEGVSSSATREILVVPGLPMIRALDVGFIVNDYWRVIGFEPPIERGTAGDVIDYIVVERGYSYDQSVDADTWRVIARTEAELRDALTNEEIHRRIALGYFEVLQEFGHEAGDFDELREFPPRGVLIPDGVSIEVNETIVVSGGNAIHRLYGGSDVYIVGNTSGSVFFITGSEYDYDANDFHIENINITVGVGMVEQLGLGARAVSVGMNWTNWLTAPRSFEVGASGGVASVNSSFAGPIGIRIIDGGRLTLNGGIVQNNEIAGIVVGDGSVYMDGGLIQGGHGPGVVIISGYMEMSGGRIINNHDSGVVVHASGCLDTPNRFIMTGGEISGNMTPHDGGGVRAMGAFNSTDPSGGVYINISGGLIRNNIAAGNGGGIGMSLGSLAGVEFVLSGDGEIRGNLAHQNGGGIYVRNTEAASTTAIRIEGGNILNNRANRNGGGIHVASAGDVDFRVHHYEDARAVDMSDQRVTISGNDARGVGADDRPDGINGYGGGINVVSESGVTRFWLYGGDIYNNVAALGGGGVNVDTAGDVQFVINDDRPGTGAVNAVDIRSNTAHLDGGGVRAILNTQDSSMNVNGGSVIGNPDAEGVRSPAIRGNEALRNGGGVHIEVLGEPSWAGTPEVSFFRGHIHDNQATSGFGGGINLYSRYDVVLSMDNVLIGPSLQGDGNIVGSANVALYGGGINIEAHGPMKFNVFSSPMSGNIAYNGGGALNVVAHESADLAIGFRERTSMRGNFADYGGGINLVAHGRVQLDIDNGSMVEGNQAENDGGAINVAAHGSGFAEINLRGVHFRYNVARAGNGGAINTVQGTDTLSPAVQINLFGGSYMGMFIANTAHNGGGALFIAADASVHTIAEGTGMLPVFFQQNMAGRGGAIFIDRDINIDGRNDENIGRTLSALVDNIYLSSQVTTFFGPGLSNGMQNGNATDSPLPPPLPHNIAHGGLMTLPLARAVLLNDIIYWTGANSQGGLFNGGELVGIHLLNNYDIYVGGLHSLTGHGSMRAAEALEFGMFVIDVLSSYQVIGIEDGDAEPREVNGQPVPITRLDDTALYIANASNIMHDWSIDLRTRAVEGSPLYRLMHVHSRPIYADSVEIYSRGPLYYLGDEYAELNSDREITWGEIARDGELDIITVNIVPLELFANDDMGLHQAELEWTFVVGRP